MMPTLQSTSAVFAQAACVSFAASAPWRQLNVSLGTRDAARRAAGAFRVRMQGSRQQDLRMAQDIGGAAAAGIDSPEAVEVHRPRRRFAERFRLSIALMALVAWLLITGSDPFHLRHHDSFIGALTGAPQWSILLAGLFLVVLTAACRWRDVGLNLPISARSLLLLWLPAAYLLLFLGVDVAVAVDMGPLPASVTLLLLLNSALAAFSEELMFRGVLFGALSSRLRPAYAILITTLLFGLAHLLNAAALGNWRVAAAQAVAAAMSGLLFIAIRVRTGSLLPAMVYHALWDFGTLFAVARAMAGAGGGAGGAGGTSAGDVPLAVLLAPILFLLPNFLYALFLFRRRKPKAAAVGN
jgi:hypothetical protein